MSKLLSLGLVSCLAVACAATERAPVVASRALCAGGSVRGDAELESYRQCQEVSGDLKIQDVCSVSALAGLRRVSGTLSISHSDHLDSLKGLEQLREVSALELRDDALLDDVSQVSKLRFAREITIEGNPRLRDLKGLSGLTQLSRLTLQQDGFYSLHGLENLSRVATLELIDNGYLIDASALNRLESAGSLVIEHNSRLCPWFGLLRGLKHNERTAISGNIGLDTSTLTRLEQPSGQVSIAAR